MRDIPFTNHEFSFVYSFNAIDFMTKPDIAITMQEITRALTPTGLCYVNFLSVDDEETWEPFCESYSSSGLLKSEHFALFEDDEANVISMHMKYCGKISGCRISFGKVNSANGQILNILPGKNKFGAQHSR
jgi:hypothetical protein